MVFENIGDINLKLNSFSDKIFSVYAIQVISKAFNLWRNRDFNVEITINVQIKDNESANIVRNVETIEDICEIVNNS